MAELYVRPCATTHNNSQHFGRRTFLKAFGAIAGLTTTATTAFAKPKQTTFERLEAAHAEMFEAMRAHYGDRVREKVQLPEKRESGAAAYILVGIDRYGLGVHRTEWL